MDFNIVGSPTQLSVWRCILCIILIDDLCVCVCVRAHVLCVCEYKSIWIVQQYEFMFWLALKCLECVCVPSVKWNWEKSYEVIHGPNDLNLLFVWWSFLVVVPSWIRIHLLKLQSSAVWARVWCLLFNFWVVLRNNVFKSNSCWFYLFLGPN